MSAVINKKNSYFISEPITGTVTLYYKEYLHISDINVSLNMIEGWTSSKARRGEIFEKEDEDNFDREFNMTPQNIINLKIPVQNLTIGTFSYPFVIQTNNLTFPSFEFPQFQVR